MKFNCIFEATVLLAGLIASGGSAQAASASGTATAIIAAPTTISSTAGLGFARVIPGDAAGTVVISPTGTRTCGPSLSCGGPPVVARFQVSGPAQLLYTVTLASSTVLSSGVETMTVDAFTLAPAEAGNLGADGTQVFNIGARLNVGAKQPAGTYGGTFAVTVEYN